MFTFSYNPFSLAVCVSTFYALSTAIGYLFTFSFLFTISLKSAVCLHFVLHFVKLFGDISCIHPEENAFDELELLGFPLCGYFGLIDEFMSHDITANQMMQYTGEEVVMYDFGFKEFGIHSYVMVLCQTDKQIYVSFHKQFSPQ